MLVLFETPAGYSLFKVRILKMFLMRGPAIDDVVAVEFLTQYSSRSLFLSPPTCHRY